MTKIYIKGLLGKKFGGFFSLSVNNIFSALKGVDANRSGFIKEIHDLSKKNINYYIICDHKEVTNINEFIEKRKIKSIYIIPAIIGSGAAVATAAGLAASSFAFAATEFLVNMAISTAVSLAISFLTAAMNKQAAPPQQNVAVGGNASVIEAKGRSYVFSNNINEASQGSSIPVGYGKMKISSLVISSSIKDYPTSFNAQDEFKSLENVSQFLDFLTD